MFVGKTRLIDNEQVRNLDPEAMALMIQTKSGSNCSYIFTHTKTNCFGYGEYHGASPICGSPDKPNAEVRALLALLAKYKRAKNKRYCVTISERARDYTIKSPRLPDLRTKVIMKDHGTCYGDLYEGSKLIGRTAIFEDDKQN